MASYRVHRGETVSAELRRIAADQTGQALAELEEETAHEAIHRARRRCKKVRALLRLVRTSNPSLYDRENRAYRDAARRVSDLRDTTSSIEAFDLLADGHPDLIGTDRFAPVREGLLRQRRELAESRPDEAITGIASDLQAAEKRIADWTVPDGGFDALAGGLAKTYGRARDRMTNAYGDRTTEAFHEWRKRVKYHGYHVRLLQDCWTGIMKARRSALDDLSDLLGDDHDLAELRVQLHADPDAFGGAGLVGEMTAMLDRRRAQLQHDARPLGERLFVESADDFVERVGRYWDIWTGQRASDELLPSEAVSGYSPAPGT